MIDKLTLRNWVFLASVAMVPTVVVLVLTSGRGLDLGSLVFADGGAERDSGDRWVYRSWSYRRIGWAKKWHFPYYVEKPVMLVNYKLGFVGEKAESVSVTIPVNGKLMDVDIPRSVECHQQSDDDTVQLTFLDVQPGEIIAFSFTVRQDSTGRPHRDDSTTILEGRSSLIGWGSFNSTILRKQEGFWEWLFK